MGRWKLYHCRMCGAEYTYGGDRWLRLPEYSTVGLCAECQMEAIKEFLRELWGEDGLEKSE